MKHLKNLIALWMAIVFAVGCMPLSTVATSVMDEGDGENEIEAITYTQLTPNEEVVLSTDENDGVGHFSFVPETSGGYIFYSYDNDLDIRAFLYDSQRVLLSEDDDSAGASNFLISYYFSAGETYYFEARPFAEDTVGTYSVQLKTSPSLESIQIGNGDSQVGCVGSTCAFWTDFYPLGALPEEITWSSDDETVVTIDEDGLAQFVGVGTAVITASTDGGEFTDTCLAKVKEPKPLALGGSVEVTIRDVESEFLEFCPTESGSILLYAADASNRNAPLLSLYDSAFEWLAESDEQGLLSFEFTEGETYYISAGYRSWEDGEDGTYVVFAKKQVPATAISLNIGGAFNGYVGTSLVARVIYVPIYAVAESILWETSDADIVSVSEQGQLSFNALGTATVTATSESGLRTSCEVTVRDYDTIRLGDHVSVTLSEGMSAYFYFTPEKDGVYSFYSYNNDYDTRAFLYDADMNLLDENDDYDENQNFRIMREFLGGATYLFEVRFYHDSRTGSFDLALEEPFGITDVELISPPYETEFYKGFTDGLDFHGLKLSVTWSDGTELEWDYSEANGWYLEGVDIMVDTGCLETEGVVVIWFDHASVSIPYTALDNPVDHLELISGTKHSYVEHYEGYEAENEDGVFFYYHTTYPSDAMIKIVYRNGSSKNAYVGDDVDGFFVSWDSDQYVTPWVAGTENVSYIYYMGHQLVLPITVKKNTVKSISVVSGKVTCLENAYGEETEFGFLYYYDVPSDVVMRVDYEDGTYKLAGIFDELDGYYFSWDANQEEDPWVLGDDNYAIVSYLGKEALLPVSVIQNKAQRIVINTAPTREYFYGDTEYGFLYDEGDYEFYPTDMEGLSFTVYYTDETSKTYTYDDIVDGLIDGYGYELHYETMNPEVGDFSIEFMYMGKTANYTVVLKESVVKELSVIKGPDRDRFVRPFEPDFYGTEIQIFYTDGSSEIVHLTEENLACEFSYFWGSLIYTTGIDGHTLSIEPTYGGEGSDFYLVRYLGASCEIEIGYDEEKEISEIELGNVSETGDGMTVDVIYADETTDSLVLDVFVCNADGEESVWGYATTEKGILPYSLETVLAENGEVLRYVVRLFGQEIVVDLVTVRYGDCDDDDDVDGQDLVLLAKFLAGWDVDLNPTTGDCDADGDTDGQDLVLLAKYLAGWGVSLG